jgi:pimeloyl-ACP methyl ester carboxylesterase
VRVVEVGKLKIGYRSAGDPGKPGLLLLHGWPLSSAIYEGVLEELGRDFYALAPDLPEVGDSSGAPASAEKHVLADIMLKAAETLHAHSIVVAGFDVGGMIAFSAAREHGNRITGAVVANTVIPGLEPWSKVIADPRIWHFAFHSIPALPETLVAGRQRPYFNFFFDFLAANPKAVTEELRNQLARAYARPEALKAGFDWYRAFEKDAARNCAQTRIDTPLLYLRGDADARDANEYVAGLRTAGVVNIECEVVRNSGEYLPIEAPREFCDKLRAFQAAISRKNRST